MVTLQLQNSNHKLSYSTITTTLKNTTYLQFSLKNEVYSSYRFLYIIKKGKIQFIHAGHSNSYICLSKISFDRRY